MSGGSENHTLKGGTSPYSICMEVTWKAEQKNDTWLSRTRTAFGIQAQYFANTLLVAMNKTSNNGNILRRKTRYIKPCTLGEVLF